MLGGEAPHGSCIHIRLTVIGRLDSGAKGNLERAIKEMKAHLKWREEYRVDRFPPSLSSLLCPPLSFLLSTPTFLFLSLLLFLPFLFLFPSSPLPSSLSHRPSSPFPSFLLTLPSTSPP